MPTCRAFFARPLLLLLPLAALLLCLGWGCDRRGAAVDDSPPAAAASAPQDTAGAATGFQPEAQQEEGAQEVATTPEARERQQQEAVRAQIGKRCVKDMMCPRYLRCIDQACAVPPAMTGARDDDTPRIEFLAAPGADQDPVASFWLELATDDAERARGLMFRREMQDDWGMLFVYQRDQPLSFWMKNTYLPLDMIFANRAGQVVDIIPNVEPLTLEPRPSAEPAAYVLELKAGTARRQGIARGQWIRLREVPAEYAPTR